MSLLVGTNHADILPGTPNGSPGQDAILGLGGNDTLVGGGAGDLVLAGAGDDAVFGEAQPAPSTASRRCPIPRATT